MGIFVLSGHRVLYRKLCKKKNPFFGGLKNLMCKHRAHASKITSFNLILHIQITAFLTPLLFKLKITVSEAQPKQFEITEITYVELM